MKKLQMRTIYFLDNLGISILNVREIALRILKVTTIKGIEVVSAAIQRKSKRNQPLRLLDLEHEKRF